MFIYLKCFCWFQPTDSLTIDLLTARLTHSSVTCNVACDEHC